MPGPTLTRHLGGVVATLVVGASLLLPHDAPIHLAAWLVVVVAGVLFAASLWEPVDRVLQVAGGVIVAGLIGLLVATTGGADSAPRRRRGDRSARPGDVTVRSGPTGRGGTRSHAAEQPTLTHQPRPRRHP
jgi:hypothetical protein